MRRLDDRDWTCAEFGQRRHEQSQFPDTRLAHKQVGERALWPYAARQFTVELSVAGGDPAIPAARKLRPSPQRWVDGFWQNFSGEAHGNYLYIYTV